MQTEITTQSTETKILPLLPPGWLNYGGLADVAAGRDYKVRQSRRPSENPLILKRKDGYIVESNIHSN